MSASSAKVNDESWHTYRFANALIPKDRWEKAFGKKDVEFICTACGKSIPIKDKYEKSSVCVICADTILY